MIKNLIATIPFVRLMKNYTIAFYYQLKFKKLKIGNNVALNKVNFGYSNSVGDGCNLGNLSMGNFSYCASDCILQNAEIGKFCAIGPSVKIGLGFHPTHLASIHPSFYSNEKQVEVTFTKEKLFQDRKKTIIGNDVWIGAGVIIMDGVKIGNGAVIGAGAVVVKNVKDYEIVGGIPAKTIRFRFSEQKISELLKSRWWDWSIEKISKNTNSFFSTIDFNSPLY